MPALAAAALVGLVVVAVRSAAVANRRRVAVHRLAANGVRLSADRLPDAPRWLMAAVADAVLPYDARVVAVTWAVAVVAVALGAVAAAGVGLALPAAALVAIGPWLALRLGRGRRSARIEAALPLALEAMARALRTGGSLRQALAEAAAAAPAPLDAELSAVVAAVARGAPFGVALDQLVGRVPLPGVRLAAAAIALGAETGGAQAKAIDGVAATIRDRLGAAAEVRAQATQARVSAGVIALSPLAFGVLSTATDHRTATFLFKTAPGLVLLSLGLGLDALGAVWMTRVAA